MDARQASQSLLVFLLLLADWSSMHSGAGAFGLVLTQVLQNTVEDLLAIGLASLAGYISVLGLPQKRAAAKEKLQNVAANFAKVLYCSMERWLQFQTHPVREGDSQRRPCQLLLKLQFKLHEEDVDMNHRHFNSMSCN